MAAWNVLARQSGRGSGESSTSTTGTPSAASAAAAVMPTGPPPTTTTGRSALTGAAVSGHQIMGPRLDINSVHGVVIR